MDVTVRGTDDAVIWEGSAKVLRFNEEDVPALVLSNPDPVPEEPFEEDYKYINTEMFGVYTLERDYIGEVTLEP